LGGELPHATEQGDGIGELPAHKGRTEEEVEPTMENKQKSLEARKNLYNTGHYLQRGREDIGS
jgi:hypothetical protein